MIIGIDASRAFGSERTGTENYSYHIITHILRLPESKTHHFVLFIRPGAVIPDWIGDSLAEVVEIPYRYLWTQIGLAHETWKRKLDVLWVPAHTLPILRKPGMRTIVTIHGLEYRWLPEYNNLLQRWYLPLSTFYAAGQAERLIAVSEFTKSQLVGELGVMPERVEVIYEGVNGQSADTLEFELIRRAYNIEPKRYILFVGTLQPRKNLPALIRAFGSVASQLPDIKLVVAGGKGWMTEPIFHSVVDAHVEDRVVFTGRVTDHTLSVLYQRALLYVQPSLQEGFGLPVLEAMKANVAVVSSNGGALPEVVGDAGVIVPLGNLFEKGLARAIARVVTDGRHRDGLIKRGRDRATGFTWERAARETLATLVRT